MEYFMIAKKMAAINGIDVTSEEAMDVMADGRIEDFVRDKENAARGTLFVSQVMAMLRKLIYRGCSSSGKASIDQIDEARIGEVELASSSMQEMAQPDFLLVADAGPPATEVAARPMLCKAVRIWSANHSSGRDVSQSPSNLG